MTLLSLLSSCTDNNTSSKKLFWGFAIEGFPVTPQKIEELEKETRVPAQMVLFYLQWSVSVEDAKGLTSSLETIWDSGAVPCLTWEPTIVENGVEKAIPYDDILNGHYDPYILFFAEEAKSWKKPFIIRLAHEMNLSRYHWGTDADKFGPESPEIYVKMFRYLVNFFKEKNVGNVIWAFCPNANSIPDEPWNVISKYYPGDKYVDILGMDGYNRNTKENPLQTFEEIFKKPFQELKKIAPDKPIFVFETATVDREGEKKLKSKWIKDALVTAKSWGLKGIVWFQVNKEEDWRINQNEDYSYIPAIHSKDSFLQLWLLEFRDERRK